MSAELQYFNRTSPGLATFYAVLFQGDNVANGGGLTSINAGLNNTVLRANVIPLVDTNHAGLYFADFLEGVPAGRYTPVVFQAVGDPTTTAATTDPVIERLPALDWNGLSLAAAVNEDTTIVSEETEME